MTESAVTACNPAIEPKQRLIVGLDVPTAAEALGLVSELGEYVGAFKVGMQLFTAAGPEIVRKIVDAGHRVFLDLKFHDIPNTVAMAAVSAARLGVWMMNVHAVGGREMMERAFFEIANVSEREGLARPKLIAVTVLTSADRTVLAESGVERSLEDQVKGLALSAESAGLDGVVASPLEIGLIRNSVKREDFMIVAPGIRPISATVDDQKRVMTFGGAVAAGADFVVVGRPITKADDRIAAIRSMLAGN
jgi:orotidine-5'-phosphate decarboxylase